MGRTNPCRSRRGCDQDRKPRWRWHPPVGATMGRARGGRSRSGLLSRRQPRQTQRCRRFQECRRPPARPRTGCRRGCGAGEFQDRHAGAVRARLCESRSAQSTPCLLFDNRLRPDGAARERGGLRFRHPGDERFHGAHRRACRPADEDGNLDFGPDLRPLFGDRDPGCTCHARADWPRATCRYGAAGLLGRPAGQPGNALPHHGRKPAANG